jgi:hypothetical protein
MCQQLPPALWFVGVQEQLVLRHLHGLWQPRKPTRVTSHMAFKVLKFMEHHYRNTIYKLTRRHYAFTAVIKESTWTGQAQTSKTSQANTTQDYSMHSSVGMLRPARKLAPLDLANMPTDAQYAKKLHLHRPMLSSLNILLYIKHHSRTELLGYRTRDHQVGMAVDICSPAITFPGVAPFP